MEMAGNGVARAGEDLEDATTEASITSFTDDFGFDAVPVDGASGIPPIHQEVRALPFGDPREP